MKLLAPDDPIGSALVEAIRGGDTASLARLLHDDRSLAAAGIASARADADGGDGDGDPGGADGAGGEVRTLLHVATDWPGHFPHVAATIRVLVDAGADVDAPFVGFHAERPLHWAASSDDVAALDALLDAGADIEAPGSVIDGTTALMDAVAFGQWQAARRLVERGAAMTPWQASALGLADRVAAFVESTPAPSVDDLGSLLWAACHGGQRITAELVADAGAPLDWVAPWDASTPLDAATRAGATALVPWLHDRLRARTARSAGDPEG